MANKEHIKNEYRKLVLVLLSSFALINVHCAAHDSDDESTLPKWRYNRDENDNNNNNNYNDEYTIVDGTNDASLRDYYFSMRPDGSKMPGYWSQIRDYLKSRDLTPLMSKETVADDFSPDHSNANNDFANLKNYRPHNYPENNDKFSGYLDVTQLNVYPLPSDYKSDNQQDSSYTIITKQPSIDTNLQSDSSSPSPPISTANKQDSALFKSFNDADNSIKYDIDSIDSNESVGETVLPTNVDGGRSSSSYSDMHRDEKLEHQQQQPTSQTVDKRQVPASLLSSYAAGLKSFAVGMADQLRNWWLNKPSNITISDNDKTDDSKGLMTDNNTNETSKTTISEVKSESQQIEKRLKQKLSVAEQTPAPKWSLLRNSEQLSAPLSSKDERLDASTNPESGSLLGRYLYAPTNHFHFDFGKHKKNEPQDDEEVLPKSYASKRVTSSKILIDDDDDSELNKVLMVSKNRRRHKQESNDDQGPARKTVIELSRSNDVLFVFLVLALCAAATTIILGAGFFAFKIQQRRKSSHDDEPPSYGVVGPNNVAAAAAAAANKTGGGGNLTANYLIAAGPGIVLPNDTLKQLNALDVARQELNAKLSKDSVAADVTQIVAPNTNSGHKALYLSNQNAAMYHYQHQKQQMITGTGEKCIASHNTSASDLESEDENDDNYTVYECPGLASAHNMEIKNPLFHDDQTPVNSPSFARKE